MLNCSTCFFCHRQWRWWWCGNSKVCWGGPGNFLKGNNILSMIPWRRAFNQWCLSGTCRNTNKNFHMFQFIDAFQPVHSSLPHERDKVNILIQIQMQIHTSHYKSTTVHSRNSWGVVLEFQVYKLHLEPVGPVNNASLQRLTLLDWFSRFLGFSHWTPNVGWNWERSRIIPDQSLSHCHESFYETEGFGMSHHWTRSLCSTARYTVSNATHEKAEGERLQCKVPEEDDLRPFGKRWQAMFHVPSENFTIYSS